MLTPILVQFIFQLNNKIKFLASENYTLNQVSNEGTIEKLDPNNALIFTPQGLIEDKLIIKNKKNIKHQFSVPRHNSEINDLNYAPILKRCIRCILPETVPFINFNKKGVCNFCLNYKKVSLEKINKFEEKLDSMRRSDHEHDSVVSFSGGRDSSYGLHLLKAKYNMNPLAVSYDWGLLSDLGRLNQSIMTSKLGIEHIWFSADIKKKRKNVNMNLKAWLKKPEFGMIPIFMAGDKMWLEVADLVGKQNSLSNIFFFENNIALA